MSRLGARILTGTALALVAAALLWLDATFEHVALVAVTVLAFLSAWELDRMGSFRGRRFGFTLYPLALVCALLVGGLDVFDPAQPLSSVQLLLALYLVTSAPLWPWLLLTRIGVPRRREDGRERFPGMPDAAALALWLLPPLYSIVLIDRDFGTKGLVVLVVLAKIGDNAGYFVGRSIGKRHPFPGISPGKTVAGCVASLVAGIVGGALVLPLTLGERTPAHFALGALVGGVINVAAQASDLSESWVKRRAGVKDSSRLAGASGGVLDVIDSLFFAAPVALLAWAWIYAPTAV